MHRFKQIALQPGIGPMAVLFLMTGMLASPAALLVGRGPQQDDTVVGLCLLAASGALFGLWAAIRMQRSVTRRVETVERANREMAQLFRMTDVLHSAGSPADVCAVVAATASRLLPRLGGAVLLGRASDAGEVVQQPPVTWGPVGSAVLSLDPASCWALKRHKPHLSGTGPGALRCAHLAGGDTVLELPLLGDGELFGVLALVARGTSAELRLRAVEPLAVLMAEATTRALSALALRDRLKNDALRDGLTGVYNRRFLDELQERLALSAERRRSPLSAIMIDIDHFKQVNDAYGHAAGDAVLRGVARAAVATMRRTDLVCRYGGEEFLVLMPDCPHGDALQRAERLRLRIAALVEGGVSVTSSFGVATIPDTSAGADGLLAAADAALYQAKRQGRNRVVAAPGRPSAQVVGLRVAAG